MDEQIKEYLDNCSIEELSYYFGYIEQVLKNKQEEN